MTPALSAPVIRPLRPAAPLLLVGLLAACAGRPPAPDAEAQRQQRQRQEQQARCLQQRQQLPALVARFQELRGRWQAIATEPYVPSPGPQPLDPEEQRRLAIYDQELEQEAYDQALARWQEQEAQRAASWRRRQAQRRAAAEAQLAAAAAPLRAINPRLLSTAVPPALQQPVLQQQLACSLEPAS